MGGGGGELADRVGEVLASILCPTRVTSAESTLVGEVRRAIVPLEGNWGGGGGRESWRCPRSRRGGSVFYTMLSQGSGCM